MRSAALSTSALLLCIVGLSACAIFETRGDARLRAEYAQMQRRVEEQQNWVAGCNEDNAMLQSWAIELEGRLREEIMLDESIARACAKIKKDCEF